MTTLIRLTMRGCQVETPCPVPSSLNSLLPTHLDDATTTIDFTTAFQASLRNAKPRRRERQTAQFEIHEDSDGSKERWGISHTGLSGAPRRRHSVRAPQEMRRLDRDRSEQARNFVACAAQQNYARPSRLAQAPKRSTISLSILPENSTVDVPEPPRSPAILNLRPARRGTIYIPNEDTTMPSMYMGIFSPIKDLDVKDGTRDRSGIDLEVTGLAAQMAMKRLNRKSVVGAAPRRSSLQPISRPLQGTVHDKDRHGQGGGKENVPPGMQEVDNKKIDRAIIRQKSLVPRNKSTLTNKQHSISAPTLASSLKCDSSRTSALSQAQRKPSWNSGLASKMDDSILRTRNSEKVASPHAPRQPPPLSLPKSSVLPALQVPSRFTAASVQPKPVLDNYPILQEDIVNPAMYEENWLCHQEIAIAQLINNLFSVTERDHGDGQRRLRTRLLEVYHAPTMTLMHRRLQATLAYGALSIPQYTLDQSTRLYDDIGMKRRFTDLWLSTYNLEALKSALEVVVGRACQSEKLQALMHDSPLTKSSKSEIRHYIDMFLVRNEDAQPEPGVKSRGTWSYQRTVLRSLMLIKVLDICRSDYSIGYQKCLFRPSSPFKSSIAVVQALMQLLNPSAGDPVRALNHIGYGVNHSQHPLEEFDYTINNLAVDMRDGIRLGRLVEIVLYSGTLRQTQESGDNEMTTILLPEGETLEWANRQKLPISQHLKTACQSRVVRLWNVELALSALKTVHAVQPLIDDITAADIVDGFREKTIKLLWALVGNWGLGGLVDWQDLEWEIHRLEKNSDAHGGEALASTTCDGDRCSLETFHALLKRWARAVTANHGLQLSNFTTSFADGRAFEVIVGEYEPYLCANTAQVPGKASLGERLRRLGCSTQFAQLFESIEQPRIFGRDFVLAALAFLCSRLLAPSRQTRAAVVIQQGWRQHWSWVTRRRKREKQTVAIACADVVNSRSEALQDCVANDLGSETGATNTNYEGTKRCTAETADITTITTTTTKLPLSPGETDIWLTL